MLLIIPYVVWMVVFGLGPGHKCSGLQLFEIRKGKTVTCSRLDSLTLSGLSRISVLSTALKNTMGFAAMAVPIGLVTGLFLALLLHLVRDKAAIGLRTIFFIPGALTGPVLVMIFAIAFDPKLSPYGLLMKPFGWTQAADIITPSTVTFLFVLLRLFWTVGGNIAIFYGALEGITPEVIEAAMIDGCDGIRHGALYQAADVASVGHQLHYQLAGV